MKIYDKKLAYPYFVWMVLFTVVPLFIVVYYAFTDAAGNFTIDNLLSVSGYGSVFARSLLLALIATVICLVIAFSSKLTLVSVVNSPSMIALEACFGKYPAFSTACASPIRAPVSSS